MVNTALKKDLWFWVKNNFCIRGKFFHPDLVQNCLDTTYNGFLVIVISFLSLKTLNTLGEWEGRGWRLLEECRPLKTVIFIECRIYSPKTNFGLISSSSLSQALFLVCMIFLFSYIRSKVICKTLNPFGR